MTIAPEKIAASQFHRIRPPAGFRLELVDGEIIVSPSPRYRHTFVVSRLFAILTAHVEANELGLVGVELDTDLGEQDVRRPDLLFVASEQLEAVDPDAAARAEDAELVVEVLSPRSRQTDRIDKLEQYAASGIPNYWVIDPDEKTFDAYVLRGKSYRIHTRGKNNQVIKARPFPELKISLARLWWSQ